MRLPFTEVCEEELEVWLVHLVIIAHRLDGEIVQSTDTIDKWANWDEPSVELVLDPIVVVRCTASSLDSIEFGTYSAVCYSVLESFCEVWLLSHTTKDVRYLLKLFECRHLLTRIAPVGCVLLIIVDLCQIAALLTLVGRLRYLFSVILVWLQARYLAEFLDVVIERVLAPVLFHSSSSVTSFQ